MKRTHINRRTMLKGLGSVAIGLPLLEEMIATNALGAIKAEVHDALYGTARAPLDEAVGLGSGEGGDIREALGEGPHEPAAQPAAGAGDEDGVHVLTRAMTRGMGVGDLNRTGTPASRGRSVGRRP